MKIHFAGSDDQIKAYKQLINEGARYRLLSYGSLKGKRVGPLWPREQLLMDSGGYVIRTRGEVLHPEEYAAFLLQHRIKYAFNMDTDDVEGSIKNQQKLEKICPSIYFMPVYHMEEYMTKREWLEDLVEKYPYISIGGIVGGSWKQKTIKAFYNYVFSTTTDKVCVHGLGITTEKYLRRYPFYSVDSTTWNTGARYGHVYGLGNNIKYHYYRNVPGHHYRNMKNIKHFLSMQKRVTQIWDKRGVVWPDSIDQIIHRAELQKSK